MKTLAIDTKLTKVSVDRPFCGGFVNSQASMMEGPGYLHIERLVIDMTKENHGPSGLAGYCYVLFFTGFYLDLPRLETQLRHKIQSNSESVSLALLERGPSIFPSQKHHVNTGNFCPAAGA